MLLGLVLRFVNVSASPEMLGSLESFRFLRSVRSVTLTAPQEGDDMELSNVRAKVGMVDGDTVFFDGYGVTEVRAVDDLTSRAILALSTRQRPSDSEESNH